MIGHRPLLSIMHYRFFLFIVFVVIIGNFLSSAQNETEPIGYLDWRPFHELNHIHAANPMHIKHHIRGNQHLAEELLDGQKVYITLTTISQRLYGIADTIKSIISGVVMPSHIYIVISKDPYLIDKGVQMQDAMIQLANVINLKKIFPYISVIYTMNIGPHRKLLPLLRHKWSEDCVIITIDDHEIYQPNFLAGMMQYYVASGRDAVVAMRCRRMAVCRSSSSPLQLAPYFRHDRGVWPEARYGRREMLTLPTGIWGILYRPQFFDEKVIFDRELVNRTRTGDDLMFRIATMMNGVSVITSCTAEMVRDGEKCPPIPPTAIRSSSHGVNMTLYHKINAISINPVRIPLVDVVSSSHGLRHRRLTITADRSHDPRKQVSLASKYNDIQGGNDMMWREAARYLKEKGIFDFEKILEEKFPIERDDCARNCMNCLYSRYIQWRDKQCGIVSC